MIKLLNSYLLGDMKVLYYIDHDREHVEMYIVPESAPALELGLKKHEVENLVQLSLTGEVYPGGYAGGNSMRQGPGSKNLIFRNQEVEEKGESIRIITSLENPGLYMVKHYLTWIKGDMVLRSSSSFHNIGDETLTLEMLSSFSLSGLSPYLPGDGYNQMQIHRLRSVWSMEGRLETTTIEDLQLEPSWAGHAIRSERFGQVGSMAVNHYFPYLLLEDKTSDLFWGVQLAHSGSWQMEAYRQYDGLSLCGGLADREFGHWMKDVQSLESFTSPEAIISVCYGLGDGIDRISHRLASSGERAVNQGPATEQNLPIIFNEYCTTWGNPSHDNIVEILENIKDKGFEYFVIDCGWYKEEGIPWDISMGDYQISKELFPDGLDKTVKAIKEKGMKPGLWFEIENVGSASRAYHHEDLLLKRDGRTLTTTMRRFWDMRKPEVQDYLTEKVIDTLNQYGFEYMKIDYNDTIGLGCDGAESLGEGLRQNMEATGDFVEKIKEKVPGIILENCASGGHRLEPGMIGKTSMSSFSDAHECEEIPIIAANLHRVMLPRQSQIWAVIQKEDSLKRIAYSLTATLLGRMCISGHVTDLSPDQWKLIEDGMAFYKSVSHLIKSGYSKRYGKPVKSYRHPFGWQAVLRSSDDEALLVIHTFNGKYDEPITITLPERYKVVKLYSDSEVKCVFHDQQLTLYIEEEMKGLGIHLTKIS